MAIIKTFLTDRPQQNAQLFAIALAEKGYQSTITEEYDNNRVFMGCDVIDENGNRVVFRRPLEKGEKWNTYKVL